MFVWFAPNDTSKIVCKVTSGCRNSTLSEKVITNGNHVFIPLENLKYKRKCHTATQTKTECSVPSLNDFSTVQSKLVAHQVYNKM